MFDHSSHTPTLVDNAFSMLNLPVQYDVSESDIQANYHKGMALWHPDRAVTVLEKNVATQRSRALNEAYQRLMHPLHRAEEVMKAYGWEVIPPGPDFLMWVLDQDAETFQVEWGQLEQSFIKASSLKNQQEASSLYGRMQYIYPRLQNHLF